MQAVEANRQLAEYLIRSGNMVPVKQQPVEPAFSAAQRLDDHLNGKPPHLHRKCIIGL